MFSIVCCMCKILLTLINMGTEKKLEKKPNDTRNRVRKFDKGCGSIIVSFTTIVTLCFEQFLYLRCLRRLS